MAVSLRPVIVAAMLVAILIGTAGVAGPAGAAAGSEPIGPNQHFIGLVNGSNTTVDVHTVCAGPASPGRTGPAVSDQTLAVARVARHGGFTGPLSQVYAWFVQDASGATPNMVTFTTYGTPHRVPAAVRVPCQGTGQVEFSPCPFRAPCVAGWRPNVVKVRFVNIAL